MRSILLTLWLAVLGLVLVCPSVPAADPIDWKPPQPALGGGLNVSLVTSGYRFNEFSEEAPKTVRGRTIKPEAKDSFVASVSLSNRSRVPISFSFNDAGPRWTFRILNSQEEEVWRSDADVVSAQVITEEVLGAGKTWKRSVRIPLVIDDVPLAAGVYTIQAFLNAGKSVSATSIFEVVPKAGTDTGIKGVVLMQDAPVPGSEVTVTPINSPSEPAALSWTGKTDSLGRFTVGVRPGRYRVSVPDPNYFPVYQQPDGSIIGLPAIRYVTAEVVVQQGVFSEVTIRLTPFTPPEIKQGISGAVRWGGITGLNGDTNSVNLTTPDGLEVDPIQITLPVNRYSVRITQIDPPEGAPAFQWSGYTDSQGKFKVATPAGKFNVSAMSGFVITNFTTGGSTTILPPNASATVTVEPNTVATVELSLQQGCVIPYGN